jgi:polysaccharide export outer membrane protein
MRKSYFALLLSAVFATCAFAGNETLLIGPGDQLHIQVFDTPEMEQHVRVTDAGTIPLMFLGEVKVGGEDPAGAARSIEQLLLQKQVMRHPSVTVSVDQYATQNVSVMGQVTNPGAYPISTPRSVVDVLSLAGGLTDAADRHITIKRRGDSGQTVGYYYANEADQALKDSVMVNPGDLVIVPKAPIVYVLGDVGRPGGFPVTSNDSKLTLLRAVALAGAANKTAIKSKCRLIRGTGEAQKDTVVQLGRIEKGEEPDIALQANDVVYVPFSFMKNVFVNGTAIMAAATSAAIYAW